jgi:hypothetical protein
MNQLAAKRRKEIPELELIEASQLEAFCKMTVIPECFYRGSSFSTSYRMDFSPNETALPHQPIRMGQPSWTVYYTIFEMAGIGGYS